jgi:hypothetical protein
MSALLTEAQYATIQAQLDAEHGLADTDAKHLAGLKAIAEAYRSA